MNLSEAIRTRAIKFNPNHDKHGEFSTGAGQNQQAATPQENQTSILNSLSAWSGTSKQWKSKSGFTAMADANDVHPTPEQYQAAKTFELSSKQMNAALNGQSKVVTALGETRPISDSIQRQAKDFQSLVSGMKVTSDMTAYRGVKHVADMQGLFNAKIGQVFPTDAFFQGSLTKSQADLYGSKETGGGTLEVHIPKGSKGAYLPDLTGEDTSNGGDSVVLPHGSKFKVVGIDAANNHVKLEVA